MKNGDAYELEYAFIYTPGVAIAEGDRFCINLPNGGGGFSYADTTVANELETNLGSFVINNGQIVATLGGDAVGEMELRDGWFELIGHAINTGDEDKTVTLGDASGVSINVIIQPNHGGDGGGASSNGQVPFSDGEAVFDKTGKQTTNTQNDNTIEWEIQVNYDGLQSAFTSTEVTKKTDVLLVDVLPAETELLDLKIMVPVYIATPDGQMSDTTLNDPDKNLLYGKDQNGNLVNRGNVTEVADAEDCESLRSSILAGQTMMFGTCQNDAGQTVLMIYFGDLPTSGLTYDEIYQGGDANVSIEVQLSENENLDAAQIDKTREVYVGEKEILAYLVGYTTKVTGESGIYTNQATLSYNNNTEESAESQVDFNKAGGGASVGDDEEPGVPEEPEQPGLGGDGEILPVPSVTDGKLTTDKKVDKVVPNPHTADGVEAEIYVLVVSTLTLAGAAVQIRKALVCD